MKWEVNTDSQRTNIYIHTHTKSLVNMLIFFFFFFPVLKNIESLFIKTIDIALVCTKGRGKN